MLIISLFVQTISSKKNKKKLIIVLIVNFVIGIVLLDFIIRFIFFPFVPANLKMALTVDGKTYGTVWFRWAVQILAALFGPFPNFNRALVFGIMHNSGLLFKVMFSFPLVYGLFRILKNFKYEYYPVLVYVVVGIFLCAVWGIALNMRYQVTFFPMMLIVIAYTLQTGTKRLPYEISYGLSCIILTGVIFLYNARSM
jgi:hypothetical protein